MTTQHVPAVATIRARRLMKEHTGEPEQVTIRVPLRQNTAALSDVTLAPDAGRSPGEYTRPGTRALTDVTALLEQRDTLLQAHNREQARLNDLVAEFSDALLAVGEAHDEQALGIPCLALGALQARVERCRTAIAAVQADLARLDTGYDALQSRLRQLC